MLSSPRALEHPESLVEKELEKVSESDVTNTDQSQKTTQQNGPTEPSDKPSQNEASRSRDQVLTTPPPFTDNQSNSVSLEGAGSKPTHDLFWSEDFTMDTLTEPGNYPMPMGGYFNSKQDGAPATGPYPPYLYSPGMRGQAFSSGVGGYGNFSHGESDQGMMKPFHHQNRFNGGDDRKFGEMTQQGGTPLPHGGINAGYYPGSGQPPPASPQRQAPSPYRHNHASPHSRGPLAFPYPSPSSKDVHNRESQSMGDAMRKLEDTYTPEKANNFRGPRERFNDYSRESGLEHEKPHGPGYDIYTKNSRYPGYGTSPDDRTGSMFQPGRGRDVKVSVKDIYPAQDGSSVSLDRPEAVPVAMEDEDQARSHDASQYRERLERSTSHEPGRHAEMMATGSGPDVLRDSDGRPIRSMTLDPSLYRREGGGPVYPGGYGGGVGGHRSSDIYNKMRDRLDHSVMNNPFFYPGHKDKTIPPSPSGSEKERRSLETGRMSAGESPTMRPFKPEMLVSGGKGSSRHPSPAPSQHDLMSPRQDVFNSDPRRSASPPRGQPVTSGDDRGPDNTSTPKALPNTEKSSTTQTRRDTDSSGEGEDNSSPDKPSNGGSGGELSESGFGSDLRGSDSFHTPERSGEFTTPPSKRGTSPFSPYESHTPKENQRPGSPKSPMRRSSLDGRGDGYDSEGSRSRRQSLEVRSDGSIRLDETVRTKKEILSDDGGEDASFNSTDSRHQPGSPPSPGDRPFNYPPHLPHPFFSGQHRPPGHVPSGHFGSPHGPSGPGHPNFPFGKDLSSRFPLPGLTPEMAFSGGPLPPTPMVGGRMPGGPMASSGPPFMPGMGMNHDEYKDLFFCHLCDYSGKTKEDFDMHMTTHFEFNCPNCDYTSRTEGRLKRHIKDFHSEDGSRRSMPGRPKVYKCKQCKFSATEKDKFWEHARSHIKEDKLLQCPKCPFVTEYKHHLEYHLRNHFGSKPFKCNKCNYSCVNKSMLNSHMKSHTNVYQYRCSDCTYATKYCHSLKLHLKKYDHKPATVLNQDGSLPQGVDAHSSGLSIIAKRGPPRGPRGPRKDKGDPYGPHLFGMPPMPMGMPGMNPMLNPMMPFWSMLPPSGMGGHMSPQPGMLPGMGNMARHMDMEPRADRMERRRMDSEGHRDEGLSDDGSNPLQDGDASICRLCDFVADNSQVLCLHFLQAHKDETSEVAKMYGISEDALLDSMSKVKGTGTSGRRMSEPPGGDGDKDVSDFHRRNSVAGMMFRDNEAGSKMENIPRPGSWSSMFGERKSSASRLLDMCYPGGDPTDEEENSSAPRERMDILQQMTLKFGNGGAMSENPNNGDNGKTHETDEQEGQELSKEPRRSRSNKETPLDLTKPKSVSPCFSSDPSSPKNDDFDDFDDKRPSSSDELRSGNLSRVTELLLRKRPFSESEDAGQSVANEVTAIVPRKRSRKGKAYKLDTLCMKLQERQSISPSELEDEDNMEMSFETFQPLNPENGDEDEENKMAQEETDADKYANGTLGAHSENDRILEEDDGTLDDGNREEMTRFNQEANEMNTEGENKQNESRNGAEVLDENEKEIVVKTEVNEIGSSKEAELSSDETEDHFEKLKRSLALLNNDRTEEEENRKTEEDNKPSDGHEMYDGGSDGTEDYTEDMVDKPEIKHSPDRTQRERVEQREVDEEKELKEALDLANDELNSSKLSKTCNDENLGEEEIDKVEMINTVLENRKKPVPPAIKRGTDLAWKLLHDPVNPVTSLPVPIESPPPPPILQQPRPMSPRPTSSSMMPQGHMMGLMAPLHNGPIRNGMKLSPHPQVSPRPHGPPMMAMKAPMPIPLPPTPMAFIPPTNRLLSDSNLPGHLPIKAPHKELYECTYCDVSFRDCVMYTVHMGYHSNRNPFQCNSCGVTCRDKVEFFLHIARAPHN